MAVQVAAGALADLRNQPGEHAYPRQHDALGHEMRGSQIKQHAGPHSTGQGLGVEPAGQAKGLPAIKIVESQVRHNMALVVVERVWPGVLAVLGLGGQAELLGQSLHHDGGPMRGDGPERAQKPQPTQLHGAPEPGVGAAVVSQKARSWGLRQ